MEQMLWILPSTVTMVQSDNPVSSESFVGFTNGPHCVSEKLHSLKKDPTLTDLRFLQLLKRFLKCTICGGNPSRLDCLVICNSCSSDKRRCDWQSGPPQKKRTQKAHSAPSEPNSKLVQCHGQVGKAFQALKRQNKELAADLEGNWGVEQGRPRTCRSCEKQVTGDRRFKEISGWGKNLHFSNAGGGDKKFAGLW